MEEKENINNNLYDKNTEKENKEEDKKIENINSQNSNQNMFNENDIDSEIPKQQYENPKFNEYKTNYFNENRYNQNHQYNQNSYQNNHQNHDCLNKKSNNKKHFTMGIFSILVLLLCFILAIWLPLISKDNKATSIKTTTPQTNVNTTVNNNVVLTDVSAVIEEIKPSLVSITTLTEYVNPYSYIFGFSDNQTYTSEGAGSGVIVGKTDSELLIVTNNHVISNSKEVKIVFVDNESISASIKATDTTNDIALLSVKINSLKDSTLEKIKIITMGDSDSLKVGEGAIAAGNALGYGLTITTGVISAKDRKITDSSNVEKIYIQTDAAINPGNSGGALVNSKGELIGINVAKISDTNIEGVGFAIPISSIKESIESMSKEQTRDIVDEKSRGYLGVLVKDTDSEIAKTYNIPKGPVVAGLTSENAKQSGLKENDIIVALNDKTVSNVNELKEELKYHKVDETVTLKVKRMENEKYAEKTITLKLSASSSSSSSSSSSVLDETYIFH